MEERRRAKRMDLESTITVKRIDNGMDEEISIDIKDLSKSGIGFDCKHELEEGAIYQSSIVIWTQEVIPALLKIVRKLNRGENGYFYGAQLMGLSDIDKFRIAVYEVIGVRDDEEEDE